MNSQTDLTVGFFSHCMYKINVLFSLIVDTVPYPSGNPSSSTVPDPSGNPSSPDVRIIVFPVVAVVIVLAQLSLY